MSTTRKLDALFYDKGGAVYNAQHSDFGAVGDGVADDTAAIQAWVDTLASGGAEESITLLLPPGEYRLTDTITGPETASNFVMVGASMPRSNVFVWDGAAGKPMFLFHNCNRAEFRRIGLKGDQTNTPSYGWKINRDASDQVGGASAVYVRFIECTAFHDSTGIAFDHGIGFTAEGTDSNNEQAVIERCDFIRCDRGIRFEHSNSNSNRVLQTTFSSCNVAVSNEPGADGGGGTWAQGGNFIMEHCTTSTGVFVELGSGHRKTIVIRDCMIESADYILKTTKDLSGMASRVIIEGGDFDIKSPDGDSNGGILWESTNGSSRLHIRDTDVGAPSGAYYDFPGTAPVIIDTHTHNGTQHTLRYNGKVIVRGVDQAFNNVTNLGSGELIVSTPEKLENKDADPTITWESANRTATFVLQDTNDRFELSKGIKIGTGEEFVSDDEVFRGTATGTELISSTNELWEMKGSGAALRFQFDGSNGQLLLNNLATEAVKVVDAGSASATEQDWIEVTVGGATGYIRVYAAK